MIRSIFLAGLLAALSACGFRPLYTGSSFEGASNDVVQIAEIGGRSGYLLRQNLLRELSVGLPGLDSSSLLTISLEESLSRAALLRDGEVARSFVNAQADYVLETDTGPVRGSARVRVPYADVASPFADVSAQTATSDRAMIELARRLVDDLRLRVQGAG
jgi:LPS-assembly lipoprotein